MRNTGRMMRHLLSTLLVLALCAANALAYDVSGNVAADSGGKRVYLSLQTQNGKFGTSIASSPGTYTIRGVPTGTNYIVQAFVDDHSTGSRHATDRFGASASFPVTSTAISGIDISSFGTTTPPTSIQAPTGLTILPSDSSALIEWNSINDGSGDVADSYELYWSSSPNAAATGTMISIPATGDMRSYILSAPTAVLTNGFQYYFAIKSKVGTVTSTASSDVMAMIGSFGSYSVSGLVTFPTGIVPSDVPMMVGVVKSNSNGPPTEFYAGIVAAPVTSPATTYTVSGVPNGSYRVYALFDVNKNGLIDIGDLNTGDANAPAIEVLNGNVISGADIVISAANAEARVNVNHWSNATQQGYVLNYDIEGKIKRPVTVTLSSGANITGPLDIALDNNGRFSNWTDLATTRPNPGDSYSFDIGYSDGSFGNISSTVTAVLDSFATPTAPIGSGVTYMPIPSFTWSAPATGAPANFTYSIELKQEGGGANWYSDSISNSLLTIPYNYDGRSSQPTLTDGATYSWGIGVRDLMGNTASYQTSFTFSGGGTTPTTSTGDANGTYTYNAGSLSLNWTSSTFTCGGPTIGSETATVSVLTATNMTLVWADSSTDSFTRISGNVGDIVGMWTHSMGTINVFLNADGSLALIGTAGCSGTTTGPWVVYNANPTNKNDIDWLQSSHSLLPVGSYIRINGTYYYTAPVGGASYWNNPSLYWGNGFYSCNQSTGALLYDTAIPPMPVRPDLSGTAGMPIEYFANWAATGSSSGPLSITTTSLTNAVTGSTYSQQIFANGGTSPYTFTLIAGSLPTGLNLSTGGSVNGTPTTAGTYSFTVQVADSVSATVSQSYTITVTAPYAVMNYGGVFHNTKSDSTQYEQLNLGTTSTATTLGSMTATVTGPGGYIYSFTDADIDPSVNGQLAFFKQLPAGTLASGVYTFTFNDGLGQTSTRIDQHVASLPALPLVDSTKIQKERAADGSYRFTWPVVPSDTTTYYYRLRVQLVSTGKPVYTGARNMNTTDTVPAGILSDGVLYQARIEVSDAGSFDLMTNRSNSTYVNFTPQPVDYVAGRVVIASAYAITQTESDGTQTSAINFSFSGASAMTSADAVTAADISGPGGFTYNFNLTLGVDRTVMGIDFMHKFTPLLAPGLYTIHVVANGLDHYEYVYLNNPSTPALNNPDPATYQAEYMSNGNIRFSWADVDRTSEVYYRIQLNDNATGKYIISARQAQPYIEYSPASITSGLTVANLSTVKWRVEVYDSSNGNTIRNRRNGAWSSIGALLSIPAYDSTKPFISGFGIINEQKSNGVSRKQLWLGATVTGGAAITQLRVDGPGGYTRNLLTQGYLDGTVYRLIEAVSPDAGLYTFTAVDSNGKSAVRYSYQPAATAIPVVDYKSFSLTTDPNGDIRFSWAPVASGIPLWYALQTFTNSDTDSNGQIDYLYGSNLYVVDTKTSVAVPASVLSVPNIMFRIIANDGSNGMTINNRSRSVLVGYQGAGFNYASLTDIDGDGFASNVDTNDNDATAYPFAPTTSDTLSPSVPSGLTALAFSSNQINLNWGVSTDNVGVTHYMVFRDGSSTTAATPAGANNTSWSDTSVAPNTTHSYTVSACDAMNNCSALSAPASATTPSGTSTGVVTISGTIAYSGTKTGRVYVSIQTNNGTLGTSIDWPASTTSAAYSIRGVPSTNVSNTIKAYMDILDNVTQSASSPSGSSAISSTTGRDITLADPTVVAPAAPVMIEVKTGPSSVFLMWQSNSVSGVVDADTYDIYWSTSASVSSSNFTDKKLAVPAGMDSPMVINSLPNGNYYFRVVPRVGTLPEAASSVVGPFTVTSSAATGLNTVSGTVTFGGTIPTGVPMYIAVVDESKNKGMGNLYFTSIAAPIASQPFSISGIPNGNYKVYVILDMNKDGFFANGDVSNTDDQSPSITLVGNAGISGLTIPLANNSADIVITTNHQKYGTSDNYSVNGSIRRQLKRPVAVTLTAVPAASMLSASVPMDLGYSGDNNGEMYFWASNNVRPSIGDAYTFTIKYSDSTEDIGVIATVTGVSDSFPLSPGVSFPVSTAPTFNWSAPTSTPNGSSQYSVWVNSTGGGNNKMWEAWSIPVSQLSIVYGTSGDSATTLVSGTQYNWNVSHHDSKGNQATATGVNFTPTFAAPIDTTAPSIISTVPANAATGVSINAPITITFSEAVTGLPDVTVALKNNTTGLYVTGTGSGSTDEKTHVFTPSSPLTAGTTYSIVFSAVKDLAGNALPTTTLTFTTAGTAAVDTTPPVTAVSVVGGSYTTAQSVALSVNEAAITYYTLNGTAPTVASTVYSTPITISTTATLKFFSKDTAGNSETPKTVIYVIDSTPPVTTASPAGGTYAGAQSVTLSVSEAATTYYTINGSVPTSASLVYSRSIVIGATTTLKFFSKDAGGNIEPVKEVQYTIDTTAPVVTILPAGGSYTGAQSVTLTANESATIYYTLDGTMPSTASLVYSGPIVVNSPTAVIFFAKDAAGNSGLVQVVDYFIDVTAPSLVSTVPLNGAANVSISSPISITFSEPVIGMPDLAVVLKNNSTGTYIVGTGTESPDKKIYTFIPNAQLESNTTYSIQLATVTDLAGNILPATTLTFTTKAATATDTTPPLSSAAVAAGVYSATQSVALRSNEAARIYYTTDGTTPTTTSSLYSVPVSISSTTTLKFFAVDTAGNVEPDVNSNLYIIVPSGDVNQDGTVDIADAYRLLQIVVGRIDATTTDKKYGNVGPLVNGIPTPNEGIDIGDVVVLLRRIVGSVTW